MKHPDLSADLDEVPAEDESFRHASQRPINYDGSPMNTAEFEEARTAAIAHLEALERAVEANEEQAKVSTPRKLDMPLNNNERRISAMKLANLFDNLSWNDDQTRKEYRFKEFAHEIADAVAKSLYE